TVFDRAEEHVVAADRSHLDDAAVERDPRGGEHGTAGRQRQPLALGKSLAACNAGAAGEDVGDLRAVVTQRVDAEHAILHHHRIGLAAAIEAHQQRRRRVGNRTDRGRGGAGLTAGAGGGGGGRGWRAARGRLLASRTPGGSTVRRGSGPPAVKAPSIASSGRWSIQLMASYSAARLTPATAG